MAQLVTAILAHQGELDATARQFTNDINEASLMVGRVVTRAFTQFDKHTPAATISKALRRDLERMIAERRLS